MDMPVPLAFVLRIQMELVRLLWICQLSGICNDLQQHFATKRRFIILQHQSEEH